ncbi:MAG: hypothetical protein ACU84J_00525 [Gammaproteobacteria bacterium]
METFARFGTRLDAETRKIIDHGRRIRACLKQAEFDTRTVAEQITVLLALTHGLFDTVPLERMAEAERSIRDALRILPEDVARSLEVEQILTEERRERLVALAHTTLAAFNT